MGQHTTRAGCTGPTEYREPDSRPRPLTDLVVRCAAEKGVQMYALPDSVWGSPEYPTGTPKLVSERFFRTLDSCLETTGWNRYHDHSNSTREDVERRSQRELEAHACLAGLGLLVCQPPEYVPMPEDWSTGGHQS